MIHRDHDNSINTRAFFYLSRAYPKGTVSKETYYNVKRDLLYPKGYIG
jgi:hypothetical protein